MHSIPVIFICTFYLADVNNMKLTDNLFVAQYLKKKLCTFFILWYQVDPRNEPHVGGNTWAGGTGGRDTAGLGGKGGPYRLDGGHDVFQISQAEKDDVPEEVERAAKEMGQKAFKERYIFMIDWIMDQNLAQF